MSHIGRRLLTALPWILLASLVVHGVLALVLPYFVHHHLQTGDHPGHLFLASFARERLLPSGIGWNERLWLGFPQDELYPPLAHLVAGLLGGLLGDSVALKLLVAGALLAVFPAGYRLGRAHGLDRAASAGLAALLWAVGFVSSEIVGTDLAYGVNVESTFRAGMVVAALGWPLLLFTLALLAPAPRPERGPLPVAAAALLALTLLTHLVAGVVAALYLAVRLAVAVLAERRAGRPTRPAVVWYAGAGAIAFLLAAFWVVPFLLRRDLISAEAIGLRWTTGEVVSLAVPPLLALAAAWVARTRETVALAAWVALVALAAVVVDRADLPTHAYRFLPVVWGTGAVALGLLLRRAPWLPALLAVAFVLTTRADVERTARGNPLLTIAPPTELTPTTRTLVAIGAGHAPGYQVVSHLWAQQVGAASHGISVESAGNNRAIFNVLRELDATAPIWSVYPAAAPPLDGDARRADRWLRKLRHLGFSHVLTDLRLEPLLGDVASQVTALGVAATSPVPTLGASAVDAGTRYHVRDGRIAYMLYEISDVHLVEPLRTLPEVVPQERFLASSELTWLQGDPQHVVTDAPPPADAVPARPWTLVSPLGVAWERSFVRFHVESAEPVPLLVRLAWHPGWEATADGQPIAVHRASPSLLLVYGKGLIELHWRSGPGASAGLALSVLALALLAWVGLPTRGSTCAPGAAPAIRSSLVWRKRKRPEPPRAVERGGDAS